MSNHTLDRQPGIDRLASDITTLKQQLSELRTLQVQGANALNLNVISSSGSLVLNNGDVTYFVFTLSSASGKRLFVAPMEFTLYEGSIASGNEIGHGNVRDLGYTWWHWRDKAGSDGNNVHDRVFINNFSGSTKTVWISVSYRFIISTLS